MKGDTVLDYVEFQLTPPRSRCELYVSADGVTEKLASGFLKPFLTHLKAAEEQNARGFQSIRLEHPQAAKDQHGKTWFTKGTLERFVRFVSTPEVLERVKLIEDELAQLEQVRNIQASSLLQTDEFYLGLDSKFSKPDGKVTCGVQEKGNVLKQPRRFQYDVDTGGEASKVELLRAMDVRLLALQQEQIMGFARAAAAGFDSRNMADLMSFSEYFGAERLCTACVHFMNLSQKRQCPKQGIVGGTGLSRETETSSSLEAGLSQEYVDQRNHNLANRGFVLGKEKHAFHQEGVVSNITLNKDQCVIEARRRWGPPESLRPKVFMSENEVDLTSSEDTSEKKLQNDSPMTGSLRQKDFIEKRVENGGMSKHDQCKDKISTLNAPDTSQTCSTEQLQNTNMKISPFDVDKRYVQGMAEKQENCDYGLSNVSVHTTPTPLKLPGRCVQVNTSLATMPDGHTVAAQYKDLQNQVEFKSDSQCSSSPKRWPPSLHVGTSGGHLSDEVAIQSLTYSPSQDQSTKETNYSPCEHSSSGSEGYCNDLNADELPPSLVCLSQPARRLSVQDAISLFESKQYKTSRETQQKQWPGKAESSRATLEVSSTTLSSRSAPRSWSAGTSFVGIQEQVMSGKQSQALQHEVAPVAASSSLNLKVPQDVQCQARVELCVEVPTQCASSDLSIQTWKPSLQSSEIGPVNSPAKPDSPSSCGDEERQKQFKLQLEKGLVNNRNRLSLQKSQNSDLTRVEMNTSRKDGTQKLDSSYTQSDPKSASLKGHTFSTEAMVHNDSQHYQLLQTKSSEMALGVARNQALISQEVSELSIPCLDSFPDEVLSAHAPSRVVSPHARGNRESLDSSWTFPLDCDIQALVKIVGSQNEEADSPSGMEGRFYEQYSKLRKAKLSEEQETKRAEREAKLKLMEETLKKRRAEMDARTARFPKNNHIHQDRAPSQQQLLKAESNQLKKEQEDGHQEPQSLELPMGQKILTNSSVSPPLTPKAVKEHVSFFKAQTGKKTAAVLPKTATTPRTSTRPAASVSPKATLRSATGAPLAHRRSAASTTYDNPLTRSVPSFVNLRKENTKPSPGRSSASTRGHSKGGGPASGRLRALCEGAPLETNVNTSVHSASHNALQKEDKKKHRSAAIRNSLASASELKTLFLGADGILVPRGQKDSAVSDPTIHHNRSRRSTAAPFQHESKPFLRKGRGIGPGAGSVVMKQKVSSSVVYGTKNCSEDEIFEAQMENLCAINDFPHKGVLVTPSDSDAWVTKEKVLTANDSIDRATLKLEMEIINDPVADNSPSEEASQHVYQEKDREITNIDVLPDDLLENERGRSTISLPIDIEKKLYAVSQVVLGSPSFVEGSCLRQEDGEALSQVTFHDTEECLPNGSVAEESASFRASSLPDELMLPYAFSPVAASPPISGVMRPATPDDYVSPSSGVNLESSSSSPASWSSPPQIQYASEADASRMNKKWAGFQKPATLGPPKGFKRLLNFARKGRASELAAADCVSASTTSEGDDESEEHGCSAGDLAGRAGLQERRPYDYGISMVDGQYSSEVQGPALSVRSSIPAPPANFRLRDDHLTGGTMLKAPRSFFSLSSFRSRVSEGKAR